MAVDLDQAKQLLARLEPWLAARIPRSQGLRIESPELPADGRSSTTILFTAHWTEADAARRGDWVLRVQPRGNQIFMHPDVLRDARILAALEGGPVPVPKILWTESDPSVLGERFFVMARIDGRPVQGRPSNQIAGWLPQASPALRRRIYDNGLAALAAVHRVDWQRGHRFLQEDGLGVDLAGHLERVARWYRWCTRGRPYAMLDAALDYLIAHCKRVDPGPTVLLWGDARMGNLMYTETGEVQAVLDWEVAGIGPANVDLGYWLMNEDFHSEANGITRLEGVPANAQQLTRYEDAAGRSVRDIDYFIMLGAWWMGATMIRQADIRVAEGRLAADNGLATGNTFTQMIARTLGLPVPELSADWTAHRRPMKGVPVVRPQDGHDGNSAAVPNV